MRYSHLVSLLLAVLLCPFVGSGRALTLVQEGVPQATIWYADDAAASQGKGINDKQSATELAAMIEEISGAPLVVKAASEAERPAATQPAVIVGTLARQMGLPPPPKTASGDGYRLLVQGNHLLLAGETPLATHFATSHLLESLGCRWFIDNPIGTVVPALPTITLGQLDIAEQPDFISRSLWGSNWQGNTAWARRNRLGGLALQTGHNWPRWFCTTDPQVRSEYLAHVSERVRDKGPVSVFISPPDGTAYCKCDRCRALDLPDYLEPSSGMPVISDRYQEFYNYIAREIKQVNPEAILCHYAYADYTLPPKRVPGGLDNLCVAIAPIRFCRLHSLANPICESRQRCHAMIEGWGRVEQKMVWREYNYNLAEAMAPFSKISIWRDDIPWLKQQGCIGLNIECLYLPHLYGPHTWLVARMAWDADLDVAAAMDDFYEKFGGKAAAHLKAYWTRIDDAYRTTPVHAGSFYGVHAVWRPELLQACQADLEAARQAAGSDELTRQRVEMFRLGFDNVQHYSTWREAVNRCDFAAAQKAYDALIASMERAHAAKLHPVAKYRHGYVPRFLGTGQSAGLARVSDGRKLVLQLPDEWLLRYDDSDQGEAAEWYKDAALTADGWQRVKTYTATLNEQQIPEQLTWMWYQTTIETPANLAPGPHTLWFMEPDGNAIKVWLNGEEVAPLQDIRARQPLDIALGERLKPGRRYLITVKLHHRRISELMLGGLLRPVMIYQGQPPPVPSTH